MGEPNLSPWVVGDLANAAKDLSREAHPNFGAPLAEVTHDWSHRGEWLEAAVLAGYAPKLEGIELAIRAHHELVRLTLLEADLETPPRGGLALASYADRYRDLIWLIEAFVAEIERWAAEVGRRQQLERGADTPPPWHRSPQPALRAHRARLRQRLMEEDNRAAKREREKG